MSTTPTKAQILLAKFKKMLQFDTDTPAVYTLIDGTEVQITKLEVGGILTIADAPAPAGEHILQDNSKVTVDESGVITMITPAPAVEDEPAALESHTLGDGTTIDVSSLEVGGAVTIAGTMAPAATYVLADGRSIVVDATGNITEIIEKAAEQSMSKQQFMEQHKFGKLETVDAYTAALEKFADGTPEERIMNLEIICKALMEQSFGWQIREAQNKANTDAAIATYQQKLSAAEASEAKQKEINTQILELVEELAAAPSADPPMQRTVSSFSKVELKSKGLAKFAEAAKKITEEQKNN
jgi:hypothetical protein